MPKSLVASVTGGLFCRNCDYKPILFKFLFSSSVHSSSFGFRLKISSSHFSAFYITVGEFQFSRFCFSRFCWQIAIFTLLIFTLLLANSNFHASAFYVSVGKFQLSRFCFSRFCWQSPIFTLLLFLRVQNVIFRLDSSA
jgi:hypothetical protein